MLSNENKEDELRSSLKEAQMAEIAFEWAEETKALFLEPNGNKKIEFSDFGHAFLCHSAMVYFQHVSVTSEEEEGHLFQDLFLKYLEVLRENNIEYSLEVKNETILELIKKTCPQEHDLVFFAFLFDRTFTQNDFFAREVLKGFFKTYKPWEKQYREIRKMNTYFILREETKELFDTEHGLHALREITNIIIALLMNKSIMRYEDITLFLFHYSGIYTGFRRLLDESGWLVPINIENEEDLERENEKIKELKKFAAQISSEIDDRLLEEDKPFHDIELSPEVAYARELEEFINPDYIGVYGMNDSELLTSCYFMPEEIKAQYSPYSRESFNKIYPYLLLGANVFSHSRLTDLCQDKTASVFTGQTSEVLDEALWEKIRNKATGKKKEKHEKKQELEEYQDKLKKLERELESERRNARSKKNEAKELKNKVIEAGNKEKKLREKIKELEESQKELARLREFVYAQTESETQKTKEKRTLEDKKKLLREKKIVIVGGHQNWIAKLRQEFPKWSFVSPDSVTINENVLKKADYAYFFTDCLKHRNYYKFLDAAKRVHTPFGYVSSINLEKNVNQFYKEVTSN